MIKKCIFLILLISTTTLWGGNIKILAGGVSEGVDRGGSIYPLGGIGMESEILKRGPIKYRLTLESDFLFSIKKSEPNTNIFLLNIPTFLKYKFLDIHSPYIEIGGFVKFLYSTYKVGNNRMNDLDMTYGPMFGIGYEWEFSKTSLNIEARYHIGFGNLELRKREESIKTITLIFSIKFW